jgi:hypothetical protein
VGHVRLLAGALLVFAGLGASQSRRLVTMIRLRDAGPGDRYCLQGLPDADGALCLRRVVAGPLIRCEHGPDIPPSVVVLDGWGRPIRAAVPGLNGASWTLWSCGPNGVDERGEGDDLVRDGP